MSNNALQNDEKQYYEQLYKDYEKTKKDLDEYVDIMRKWADTQSHFPEKPSYKIIRFVLLYNKFSIEKAKQKLDMFYSIRNLMPEIFRTTPFSDDMIQQFKTWHIICLPKVADDYSRIIYQRINPQFSDPKYFSHEKMLTRYVHLAQYMAEEDLCYRFHYVFDCDRIELGHAIKLTPLNLKKFTIILEKIFSNRMISVYIVNFPTMLETILNTLVRPLLHPKIRSRIVLDSGTSKLFAEFDKDILPKDIGGNEKSLAELNDMIWNQYEQHKERFVELSNLNVDESLRPSKLENDEMLGYYGNFKKINVD